MVMRSGKISPPLQPPHHQNRGGPQAMQCRAHHHWGVRSGRRSQAQQGPDLIITLYLIVMIITLRFSYLEDFFWSWESYIDFSVTAYFIIYHKPPKSHLRSPNGTSKNDFLPFFRFSIFCRIFPLSTRQNFQIYFHP